MRILCRPVPGTARSPIITLAQLRAQVRIDDFADDLTLAGKLAAATAHIEKLAGRTLAPVPMRATFEAWPDKGPLVIQNSVNTIDSITVGGPAWIGFVARTSPGGVMRVRPASGGSWPVLAPDALVTLDATGGYATPPPDLIEAVCLVAAHLYANREAVAEVALAALPFGVRDLVRPHRWRWLG